MWEIWNARNKLVFNGQVIQAEDTLTKAIAQAREWQSGQQLPKQAIKKNPKAPRVYLDDIPLLRTDAAWSAGTNGAGLGWIIQRNNNMEEASSMNLQVASPLVGEALALREALEDCQRRDITKLVCESDSLQLINSIRTGNTTPEIYGVVSDILFSASLFESISFEWIPRERNREADTLAKHCLFVNEDLLTSNSI